MLLSTVLGATARRHLRPSSVGSVTLFKTNHLRAFSVAKEQDTSEGKAMGAAKDSAASERE
jgi:hypothetical protein